jgi:hypothetical protein
VSNGVVVPNMPLPDGTQVEIRLPPDVRPAAARWSASELRRLPRDRRQSILAVAAAAAEADYRDDKDLTGFDAFSEELDDDAA